MVSERWEKILKWEDGCFAGFVIIRAITIFCWNLSYLTSSAGRILIDYYFSTLNQNRTPSQSRFQLGLPCLSWIFYENPLRGWTMDLPFFPSSEIYYNSPELKDIIKTFLVRKKNAPKFRPKFTVFTIFVKNPNLFCSFKTGPTNQPTNPAFTSDPRRGFQAPRYRTKGDGFATSLIGSQAFLKLWICPGGIVDEPRKQKTVQPGGGMDKCGYMYNIYICPDGHMYI